MKRVVISCILIFALANQAYAMGWLGGSKGGGSKGGDGGSTASVSNSGGGSSGSGSTGNGSGSTASVSNTDTSITPPNSPTGGSTQATGGEGSSLGSTITVVGGPLRGVSDSVVSSVPEVTTMFLLGSALLGLWGFRRKIKK
jgi:hypothetical protein